MSDPKPYPWLRVSAIKSPWLRRLAIVVTFPVAIVSMWATTLVLAVVCAVFGTLAGFFNILAIGGRGQVQLTRSAIQQWRRK
jgi:hypothetical protein